MWVVSSSVDSFCVRPTKPPHVEEGGVVLNPSFWIRPGKTYTAGRNEGFDLFVTHPKISRKAHVFSLTASEADTQNCYMLHERDIHKPSYKLTIKAEEQSLLVIDGSGSEIAMKPGNEYNIVDGVRINMFTDKARECYMSFNWRPVHVYHRLARKRDLQELQDKFGPLGVTFSSNMNHKLPDWTHTHGIFQKFQAEPGAVQLIAANCQLKLVDPAWIDALCKAAQLQKHVVNVKQEDKTSIPKEHMRSNLELDLDRFWPSESQHFPAVEGKASNSEEKMIYMPNPRRCTLFEKIVFIDCSGDPNIPPLVTTAGGQVCTPKLDSVAAFGASVAEFCEALGASEQQRKKYVVTPILDGLLAAAEETVVRQLAGSNIIDGYVAPMAIFTAIKDVTPIGNVTQDYDGNALFQGIDAPPAPTPTVPGATADITIPATHPGDVAASAPVRRVEPKRAASPAVDATEGRPSKRPKKLADRGPIDPFANIFAASSFGLPESDSVQPVDARNETQQSSIGSRRGVQSENQDSQSESRFSRPDSKYAKLKRRVGQTSASQLTPLSELELPDETDEPPHKKVKSFNPDIESATSQATVRLREKEEKERLASVLEVSESGKAVKSGKREAEVLPDSDDESSKGSTQAIKKATQTGKAKAKADEAAKIAAKEAGFLQVKTGRRKIAKADAALNEDFNALRLRKPQAMESHKMGWKERDVFQEEMAEEAVWEAEDKSTFFQIRYLPMARPKDAAPRPNPVADPRYAGKPNFKAFRPKNAQATTSNNTRDRASRPQISLVAQEPLGYGLRESYGEPGTHAAKGNEDDSDESIEMPMPESYSDKKGKGKAKAKPQKKAHGKSARTAKGKRAVVTDSEDDSDETSSTARDDSASIATMQKAKGKESITIESSSDDEDGKTFKGFGTSSRIDKRRR